MALATKGIFIVGAKRTPFCKYGGSLRDTPASHAFAAAAKSALQAAKLDPSLIDATIVGNVNFLSQCDGGKTPRYCGLYSGAPVTSPALAVNKACGSGLQSLISGALEILASPAQIVLAGGTEIMSALPLVVRNARFGIPLGADYQLEEYISRQDRDSYTGLTLQQLAEEVARKYKLTREEVDAFAADSYVKWKAGQDAGHLKQEIAPITVTIKRKEVTIDADELPRAATMEDLARLPALVQNGSVVTSGNSSSPGDGAAAVVLASEEAVRRHRLAPLARLVGWAGLGVSPEDCAGAAAPAARRLLAAAGRDITDIDILEMNETFAAGTLASVAELQVPLSRVNTGGGALTMGHPVAATGARMALHLVYELARKNLKTAVAATSCGGGQGIAVMLERI